MRLNLTLVTALAVLHVTSSAVHADDASKSAKVEEFMRLAKMDETLRQSMTLMTNQIKSGMLQQMMGVKLPPEAQTKVDAFTDKVIGVVSDALAWEKLKPDYVKLFSDAYTETELDDILAFYRSPTGQSMVAKTPALMTKSSQIAQQKLVAIQSDVQKLIHDFILESQHDGDRPERKK